MVNSSCSVQRLLMTRCTSIKKSYSLNQNHVPQNISGMFGALDRKFTTGSATLIRKFTLEEGQS